VTVDRSPRHWYVAIVEFRGQTSDAAPQDPLCFGYARELGWLLRADVERQHPAPRGAPTAPPPRQWLRGAHSKRPPFTADYAALHGMQSDEYNCVRWRLVALTRRREQKGRQGA